MAPLIYCLVGFSGPGDASDVHVQDVEATHAASS